MRQPVYVGATWNSWRLKSGSDRLQREQQSQRRISQTNRTIALAPVGCAVGLGVNQQGDPADLGRHCKTPSASRQQQCTTEPAALNVATARRPRR
jgi:hypothetical protein